MIQADHLTKSYGPVTAIHDVSFNVDKGQIVGFLGPNGAGKSTTMKILACFMAATGGRATVAGFDVFSQSLEVRRRIGYLPENAPLYGDLPVAAYLDFVAEAKGVSRGLRRSKVADVMDRCAIADMQHRLIGKLSKGYRQRVGLAQALLGDPEVSMVCDSIIIINRGRIVAQGTQSELVQQVFPAARVEVEIGGPSPAVAAALKALPGVTSVDAAVSGDGAARFVIESPRGRDVRGDLTRLVAARGWELLELHTLGLSLEEVFIRVVAGEEHTPQIVENVQETT